MSARHLTALTLSLALAPSLPAADQDGFVPLFNGKDLSGWVNANCHPGTFFVKGDEIVTTGKPTGFLRTERQYENFVLELEWMHVNKTEVGNSGVFVWGDPLPVTGSPFTRGIEVQVLVNLEYKDKKTGAVTASSHGDVFSIQGATCKPDRPHPTGWLRCIPSEFRAKGGGEWNHYKITANDGAIKLAVNGKEVSGVSACKPHRKGYLALESEGAECHFRNIRIKELPSTNPKPGEVAPEAQGHVNLLTGIELRNWKADEGHKKHWQFQDWRLVYDGKGGAKENRLWSEKEYGDFELIADWRFAAKKQEAAAGRCGLALRGGQKDGLRLVVDTFGMIDLDKGSVVWEERKEVKPPGQWNRFRVRAQGDRLTMSLNDLDLGKQIRFPDMPAMGRIGLLADGPVEFANVFIREIKGD